MSRFTSFGFAELPTPVRMLQGRPGSLFAALRLIPRQERVEQVDEVVRLRR